ncbi:ornithine cyclodeaminase family protein [Chloroflexota bacterium]
MQVFTLDQIKAVLPDIDLMPEIEAGFVAYARQEANIPPVGELLLDKGEVHIKYGALKQDDTYIIKIASGFYDNPKIGLPVSNGMMLLFSQETGAPQAILYEECYLTDVRTAVAGAIAAKYLAPQNVQRIGIVGAGIQGRLQLQYLREVIACRDVLVWGRDEEELAQYRADMADQDFTIETTLNAADVLRSCNLVVTVTPASAPLIHAADLQPGTHITAVGSDTPHKQEVDAAILGRADLVVADSIAQCLSRGEIYQALQVGAIQQADLVELGAVIAGDAPGRTSEEQITVADLTGVAVQDIKITAAVYQALAGKGE